MSVENATGDICRQAASSMRIDILRMALNTGNHGAHLGGSLSLVEIMAVLYLGIMRTIPTSPLLPERDRLILSKGHGAPAYYAAMKQVGLITDDELLTFKSDDTFLYGHPSMNRERGIEFSSGSLGLGIGLGIGTAIALRRKDNNARVFVVLGDGECDEGSVWEGAMSAAHFKLDNLVVVVDKNGLQYDGDTRDILDIDDLAAKWSAFGWDAVDVDGHNVGELLAVLSQQRDAPLAVIAHTVKGKGVSFMENVPGWHHKRLTRAQFEAALIEVEGP